MKLSPLLSHFLVAVATFFITQQTNVVSFQVSHFVSEEQPQEPLQEDEQDDAHLLEDLLYKYGSDKSKDDHGYTDIYQMIFRPLRHAIRNVTEVGVSAGQSLQAWYHYFPQAIIHGYDVDQPSSIAKILEEMPDRLRFNKLDLLKVDNLSSVGLHEHTMDVVIDDAMHANWQQQRFLTKLFPLVKPGGYYVIEDINLNDENSHKWQRDYEQLNDPVRNILETNDAVFVDAHTGHRAWSTWLERTQVAGTAADHVQHNSHLIVIRKRVQPVRETPQVNLRVRAMMPHQVVTG